MKRILQMNLALALGAAAMALVWPSLHVKAFNPQLDLGSGPLPYSAPGESGAVWTGGWHIAAAPNQQQRGEAWDFMRWVSASDEGTLGIVRRMAGVPGWVKSPGLDELARSSDYKPYVDAMRRAKFLPPGFYAPVSLDFAPVNDVLTGKRSAKEALDMVQDDTQRKLDEFKAQQKR